jgi:hypothetical protein
MRKQDILKMHGLTEKEFYKKFPTEESYIKAMGGSPFQQFYQMGGIPDFFDFPYILMEKGGMPCYGCGGTHMQTGGVKYGSMSEFIKAMEGFGHKKAPGFPEGTYYDTTKFSAIPDPTRSQLVTWIDKGTGQEVPYNLMQPKDLFQYQAPKKIPPIQKTPSPNIEYKPKPAMMKVQPPGMSNEEFIKQWQNLPWQEQSKKYGGGLSRSEDYGSKKKPYPSVDSSDFAGGDRSYPIPTKADAIDALRLAGLHGRADVKAKVYAKYPELKKQFGGTMTQDLEALYPMFNFGGFEYQFGGDPSIPVISSQDSLKIFQDIAKKAIGGAHYPGQDTEDIIERKKNSFINHLKGNTLMAIANEEGNAFNQHPLMRFMIKAQDGTNVQRDQFGRVIDPGQTSYVFYDEQGNPVTADEAYSPTSKLNVQKMYQRPQQQKAWSFTLPSGREQADAIMLGLQGATSMINQVRNKKAEDKWKAEHSLADNIFNVNPGGNRGDYDQWGRIRPNAKVPVQFSGYNTGQSGSNLYYQEGGEYFLTDDQINSITESGGDIEFLD